MPPQVEETFLSVKVGCHPGSEFCGGCGERRLGSFDTLSDVFSATCAKFGGRRLLIREYAHIRCPACLEAEAAHKALLDRADARRTVGPMLTEAAQTILESGRPGLAPQWDTEMRTFTSKDGSQQYSEFDAGVAHGWQHARELVEEALAADAQAAHEQEVQR